ncbi:ABC transporter ATP-binding protein [Stackebrandtia soli]|uniref:ABC transporter ATP-binding protein n=1 Tax=Stackebrandtia soli TaxID=1892856 RepID=UPI0039EAFD2B
MDIRISGLTASYPGVTAVNGVDVSIASGSIVAIVGPNGCGKSTLLRCMARLHRPDSGTIAIDDRDVWNMRPREAAKHIGLLPQAPVAPEAITVAGLVAYGRHPHQGLFRQWSRSDAEACERALADTGVAELADRRLETLSGGQRQRCWLAMVLAQDTPVVLLDEPTSALDLGHAVEVLTLVRSVARAGRTVVMVVHDLAAAARYADVVVAMRGGEVVDIGDARDVVTSELVRRLYDIEADVLAAPGDGAPVVVPRVI